MALNENQEETANLRGLRRKHPWPWSDLLLGWRPLSSRHSSPAREAPGCFHCTKPNFKHGVCFALGSLTGVCYFKQMVTRWSIPIITQVHALQLSLRVWQLRLGIWPQGSINIGVHVVLQLSWYSTGFSTTLQRIEKAAAPIDGWDCPLLSFTDWIVMQRLLLEVDGQNVGPCRLLPALTPSNEASLLFLALGTTT